MNTAEARYREYSRRASVAGSFIGESAEPGSLFWGGIREHNGTEHTELSQEVKNAKRKACPIV